MKKKEICALVGGTLAGMCAAMSTAAGFILKEKFVRHAPKPPAPGSIESVDEMHMDYLRRKGSSCIKSQLIEQMEIISSDGLRLKGEYVHNTEIARTPGESIRVVILSHGYGGNGYRDLLIFSEFYIRQGFDILIIDQRSHGRSEGKYITFGDRESEDMALWVSRVIETAGTDCKILLHGWSMGAAIVYLCAAKGIAPQVKGVIYDCGFDSAEAQMFSVAGRHTHLPMVMLWYLMQFLKPIGRIVGRFDIRKASPIRYASQMQIPVFFVHGEQDSLVPVQMCRRLRKATRNTYTNMLIVPGADHTYSYVRDKAGYEAGIKDLITHCMG